MFLSETRFEQTKPSFLETPDRSVPALQFHWLLLTSYNTEHMEEVGGATKALWLPGYEASEI